MIVTELIKKYVKVRENERSIQTVWRRADCSGRPTSAFLVLMGNIVLAQGGMLAQLINIWGNSAI